MTPEELAKWHADQLFEGREQACARGEMLLYDLTVFDFLAGWNARSASIDDAVVAEREACAKIADAEAELRAHNDIHKRISERIAAAIRSRTTPAAVSADRLTDEQIIEIWDSLPPQSLRDAALQFGRAIEAAIRSRTAAPEETK
jgi:hypothetical protein